MYGLEYALFNHLSIQTHLLIYDKLCFVSILIVDINSFKSNREIISMICKYYVILIDCTIYVT